MDLTRLRSATPIRVERVQWREFGSDGMLLDPVSGVYLQINDTGLAIWEHIDGQMSVDQILAVLADACGVSQDAIASDVLEFLETLANAGMIDVTR